MSRRFTPTHILVHEVGEREPVQVEDGVIYTAAEWAAADTADYTLADDGSVLFQGGRSRARLIQPRCEVCRTRPVVHRRRDAADVCHECLLAERRQVAYLKRRNMLYATFRPERER